MSTDWNRSTQLEAFRQHWEQMRHAESQRLQYTAFFAVVLGAVVGLSDNPCDLLGNCWLVRVLLLGLAAFGFVLSVRTTTAIERHRECAKRLAGDLTSSSSMDDYVAHWSETGIRKLGTFKVVFPILYGFVLLLLLIDWIF